MATAKKQRSKPAAQQPIDPNAKTKKAKSSRNTVNKKTDHKAADASDPNTFCVCPGWDIPEDDLNCDSYGEATTQKGCLCMERGAILVSIRDVPIEERADFIQGQTVFSETGKDIPVDIWVTQPRVIEAEEAAVAKPWRPWRNA